MINKSVVSFIRSASYSKPHRFENTYVHYSRQTHHPASISVIIIYCYTLNAIRMTSIDPTTLDNRYQIDVLHSKHIQFSLLGATESTSYIYVQHWIIYGSDMQRMKWGNWNQRLKLWCCLIYFSNMEAKRAIENNISAHKSKDNKIV